MGLLKSNYSSGQMECGKLWFPPDCAALHDMKILIVSFVDDETHQGINLVASVTAVEARFSYVIYSSQCVKDISFAMFGMSNTPVAYAVVNVSCIHIQLSRFIIFARYGFVVVCRRSSRVFCLMPFSLLVLSVRAFY